MSSESVCQVAPSWVDVGSFHKRLVVRFMTFTASVRNILDTHSYFYVKSIMSLNEEFIADNQRKYSILSQRNILLSKHAPIFIQLHSTTF
jgi:hypothetical protein